MRPIPGVGIAATGKTMVKIGMMKIIGMKIIGSGIPPELEKLCQKAEEAMVSYTQSRSKMTEFARARGFYPVVAMMPNDFAKEPKGKGKGEDEEQGQEQKSDRALDDHLQSRKESPTALQAECTTGHSRRREQRRQVLADGAQAVEVLRPLLLRHSLVLLLSTVPASRGYDRQEVEASTL